MRSARRGAAAAPPPTAPPAAVLAATASSVDIVAPLPEADDAALPEEMPFDVAGLELVPPTPAAADEEEMSDGESSDMEMELDGPVDLSARLAQLGPIDGPA